MQSIFKWGGAIVGALTLINIGISIGYMTDTRMSLLFVSAGGSALITND